MFSKYNSVALGFAIGATVATLGYYGHASHNQNAPVMNRALSEEQPSFSLQSSAAICDMEWNMEGGPDAHYDASYFEWQKKIGEETAVPGANNLRKSLPIAGSVVADIGCGGGFMLSELEEASQRYCFEINPVARAAHPSNVVSVGKWSEMDDDSVDVMYSNHSFEHHPHPLLSLQCAKTKLRPETGLFYLAVPFEHTGCGLEGNDYGRSYDVPNPSFHIYTWSPRNLGQFMHAAGFVDIECIDTNDYNTAAFSDHPFHTLTVWCVGRRP